MPLWLIRPTPLSYQIRHDLGVGRARGAVPDQQPTEAIGKGRMCRASALLI